MAAVSEIHQKWAWAQSRALLGSIGPVPRARVCDLINADPDKPLPAPQRVPRSGRALFDGLLKVQQRGLAATQAIIDALLDGVELGGGKSVDKASVFVVDILPKRRGSGRSLGGV